jgi:hypothetical protein
MKLGRSHRIRVATGSGLLAGFLASGVAGLLASACGSSATTSTAVTSPPDGGLSDASSTTFGAPCARSEACSSKVCLLFTANAQQATGICSSFCSPGVSTRGADSGPQTTPGATACGSAGACIPVAVLDGGACYPTCSAASDCAGGLPCIWNQSLDAGLCQPVPLTFCTEIAPLGSCEKCLGVSCCGQVTACAEDVDCSKLEATCPGNSACASALQASGETAAQALGSCAASSCAADCQ